MPDDRLSILAAQIVAFRDERDWRQFHNAKDQALSLVLEAAELLGTHAVAQRRGTRSTPR